nr:cyclin-A2-3-like [Leptinotarsa decemlineata]
MRAFRVHVDGKENAPVPGCSKAKSSKISEVPKETALRDKKGNVLPTQRNKFPDPRSSKTENMGHKIIEINYKAVLKQEMKNILTREKKNVFLDPGSGKATAVKLQPRKSSSSSSANPTGSCRCGPAIRKEEGRVPNRQSSGKLEAKHAVRDKNKCEYLNIATKVEKKCEEVKKVGKENIRSRGTSNDLKEGRRSEDAKNIMKGTKKCVEAKNILKDRNKRDQETAPRTTRTRSCSLAIEPVEIITRNSTKPRMSINLNPEKLFLASSTMKLENRTEYRRKCSPIPPNPFTSSNTLISRKTKSQRSAKLVRRALRRINNSAAYVGDIYNEEYLEVNLEIVGAKEGRIVLPMDFLEKFNPDQKFRASVVNWMLEIQEQVSLNDEELYLSVNLLDQVLARTTVPTNMYQLLAVSTIWIANKLIGSDILTASTLLDLCGEAYMLSQLIKMERKVLKLMNFEIHSIEPSLYINYYLKLMEIHQIQLAHFSVYYILDCTVLLPEFSSSRLSILAAAALNVAIKLFCPDLEEKSNEFFSRNLSIGEIEKRKSLEAMMYSQVLNMNNESYVFRQPFYKRRFVSNCPPSACTV